MWETDDGVGFVEGERRGVSDEAATAAVIKRCIESCRGGEEDVGRGSNEVGDLLRHCWRFRSGRAKEEAESRGKVVRGDEQGCPLEDLESERSRGNEKDARRPGGRRAGNG